MVQNRQFFLKMPCWAQSYLTASMVDLGLLLKADMKLPLSAQTLKVEFYLHGPFF